jgi:hypothetical protein
LPFVTHVIGRIGPAPSDLLSIIAFVVEERIGNQSGAIDTILRLEKRATHGSCRFVYSHNREGNVDGGGSGRWTKSGTGDGRATPQL